MKSVLTLKTSFYTPNIFTVCFEILELISEDNSNQIASPKMVQNLTNEANLRTYKSLSNITRLPPEINPLNTKKMCSYVVIDRKKG